MQQSQQPVVVYSGENIKKFRFPDNFDHRQSAVVDNPCYNFRFRIFVFFTYIVITELGELFGTPTEKVSEPQDSGHAATQSVNDYIRSHKWFASLLQIISSGILDFAFFYVSLYWVLYIRNFRFFAALIVFYLVRSIHLGLLQLPYPQGYYWEDPGVPALVVKYGDFSDFFYSGHVGFLIICALEMRRLNKMNMAIGFFIAAIFQGFVVIVFRIHYTLDVAGGFVYAHYFYNMACHWEVKIDYYLKQIQDRFNRQHVELQNTEIVKV